MVIGVDVVGCTTGVVVGVAMGRVDVVVGRAVAGFAVGVVLVVQAGKREITIIQKTMVVITLIFLIQTLLPVLHLPAMAGRVVFRMRALI